MIPTAYPLAWPPTIPRTETREFSPFRVSQEQALNELLDELRRFGARDIVISTNIPLRRDGLPYAAARNREPDDPGVAAWFTVLGNRRVIACDRWLTVGGNIRAIDQTIFAIRGIERWGTGWMRDAAFAGFAALGPGSSPAPHWCAVLDVPCDATLEQIEAAYRQLARRHHPDNGGDEAAMAKLNEAVAQARAAANGTVVAR